jgi:hypothetical protein
LSAHPTTTNTQQPTPNTQHPTTPTTQHPAARQVVAAQRPELRIATMKNDEVCSDALSIRGFEAYRANDYHLEFLPTDNHFYIVSPKDIVVAKPCDLDDHITWPVAVLVLARRCHVLNGRWLGSAVEWHPFRDFPHIAASVACVV